MELRPDALAAADLNELMRHLTNAFIARARIPIQVTVECDHSLPVDIKIAFYRVAQEALNNIAKHSEATRVSLSLVCSPQEVALSVADDGQGFDLQSTRSSDHYGLKIMQERADEIGALIEIESRIKQGTQIKMVWLAEPDQNSEKRAG
jgi:signal transduction histidine kinase